MSKDTLLGFGGAVYINNEGEVRDNIFTNNVLTGTFAGYGGALSIKSGTVINCNFTNNKVNATVESNGGGLWIRSGTVRYCKFNNNYASKLGGALWTEDHSTISDCDFNNNKASDSGGAILYRYGGEVENCNFTNNSATDSGAIEMRTGNVINSNFNNNSAITLHLQLVELSPLHPMVMYISVILLITLHLLEEVPFTLIIQERYPSVISLVINSTTMKLVKVGQFSSKIMVK